MIKADLEKYAGKRFLFTLSGDPQGHARENSEIGEVSPTGNFANIGGKWVLLRGVNFAEELAPVEPAKGAAKKAKAAPAETPPPAPPANPETPTPPATPA